MVEETASATPQTMSVEELIGAATPLPLVAPFVSGTPCVTPDGHHGHIVSDSLILEGPDGRGGTRKFIASYWQEARLHVSRGAKLCTESTIQVRVGGKVRRFHAGDLKIVTRHELVVPEEE